MRFSGVLLRPRRQRLMLSGILDKGDGLPELLLTSVEWGLLCWISRDGHSGDSLVHLPPQALVSAGWEAKGGDEVVPFSRLVRGKGLVHSCWPG